jgi:general secretion pathway protein F
MSTWSRAGETGGVLPSVLERLGVFLENSQDLKDYITSAMVYPMFLVLVGGLSIIVMLTFVIPKFSLIFADMGQAMPASTQMLLAISNGLRDYWWAYYRAVIAGISLLIRQYIRTPAGRLRFDRLKFQAPVVGRLIKSVEAARFSRTLGTLIRSGVPILQALTLVREIITNKEISVFPENRQRPGQGRRYAVGFPGSGRMFFRRWRCR